MAQLGAAGLAPTVPFALLMVHERMNTIMRRVNDRLCERGLLATNPWWCSRAAEYGDRWHQGVVEDGVRDAILDRWFAEDGPRRPGVGYVVRLSGLSWLVDEFDAEPVAGLPVSDLEAALADAATRTVAAWHVRRDFGC